jgi:hypothetical protein
MPVRCETSPLAHAMQRLQIQLLGRLGRDELHRRPLYRLGIAEVVLLSLRIGAYILRRHQPGLMAQRLELPAQMMRTNAGLHADEARRHIGEPRFHLPARPLLAQSDRTARVKANHVETVLADVDAHNGDRDLALLNHRRAPCLWCPLASFKHRRGRSTAGPFH